MDQHFQEKHETERAYCTQCKTFMLQNDFFVQLPKALKSSKDGSMDVENIAIDVTGDANGFL